MDRPVDRSTLPILQRTFRRRLNVWLDALIRAFDQQRDPGSEVSARRLARGLGSAAQMHALDDLAAACRLVFEARPAKVWSRLVDLIDRVRHTADPSDRDRRTVLVLSTDPDTIDMCLSTASAYAHRVEVLPDEAEARRFVARHAPGLLFLDLDLRYGDSLTWLMELREGPAAAEFPVIALGTEGPLRSEVLALGASEFIRKPLTAMRCAAVVGAHLGHEERTQLELAGDPLTGLPGPALFQEAVRDQGLRNRGTTWMAVLVGWSDESSTRAEDPQAADAVLRSVADQLSSAYPNPALVCRLDSDTFGLLIPQTDPDEDAQRLEGVLATIGSRRVAERSVRLVAGGVIAQTAPNEQVLSTARRMRSLAGIAGESVLVTSLESSPSRRVLLVDQDPEVAVALRGTLSAERADVVHRRTALEGLEVAAGTDFDVVLVSAALPHKSGFDMLEALRAWPHYATRPLLMFTGGDPERVRAFEVGADQCIDTPFNPQVLQAQLRALFQPR